jgi:hypothetical protein
MAADGKDTLIDVWIRWLKNNPLFAVIIFLAIVIGAISSSAESAKKLFAMFKAPQTAPAPPEKHPPKGELDVDKFRAELTETQELITKYRRDVERWNTYLADRESQLNLTKGAKPQTEDEIRSIVASISLQEKVIEESQANKTKDVNALAAHEARAKVLLERIAARP